MRRNGRLTTGLVLASLLAGCGGEPTETVSSSTVADTSAAPTAPLDADLPPPREPVPVEAIEISYGETGDSLLRGYFVYPSGMLSPPPAVIVVHDWWGLDDAVRASAAEIAGQGYMVLAVDLFRGDTADSREAASALARTLLEEPDFAESNLRAAHQFLKEAGGAPAVATLGWSLGGYWAMEATRFLPEPISAAVLFYTQPVEGESRIEAINTPILGLYGGGDTSIPVESVRAFRDAALAAGKTVDVVIYADAKHGFATASDSRYNEGVAGRAWRRTLAFLDQYLRDDGASE